MSWTEPASKNAPSTASMRVSAASTFTPMNACPVEAIFYEDDVPDEWIDYIDANAAFFDDLGSPGGAQQLGPQDFDVPLIADLPPQA